MFSNSVFKKLVEIYKQNLPGQENCVDLDLMKTEFFELDQEHALDKSSTSSLDEQPSENNGLLLNHESQRESKSG